MPYYLFSGRYSQASMKALVAKPQDRRDDAKKALSAVGGKLHHMFFAFGQDDVIALIEAPDDTAYTAAMLAIGASGAMSGGATTRLITMEEAVAAMKMANKSAKAYKPPKS